MNRRQLIIVSLAAGLLLTGCFGGGGKKTNAAIDDSRYTRELHNRFYGAWTQPESVSAPRGKISVPVDVEIDRDGRVRRFKIAQSSGYRAVDDSIRAAGKLLRQVDPPPIAAGAERLQLRVHFDLDVRR